MAYLKLKDVPESADQYANHCVDGKCSGCGECCVDILTVTPAEIGRIKEYVQKHNIKEHRQAPFYDPNATDLSCPFRNQQTRKCEIYPVRPYICRTFICSKTVEDARNDRDLIHQDRKVYSLRWEVFENPETIGFLLAIAAKKIGKELYHGAE